MSPLYSLLVSFFLSLLVVSWIHPRLVKIALLKNIVDNPDARKLQRTPVPVLGGVAVFFGIVIGIGSVESAVNSSGLLILVVLLLIHAGGYCIDDFHGLWGIGRIPRWIAVPLTVVASVGIINAINLIDGVNGLSSGFCILACMMFGTLFYLSGDMKMTLLAVVSVGALIPFFFHNVFGKTSKMFIGDGGTLVMGIIMSIFVIEILQSGSLCAAYVGESIGLIPFALAVLCIPVFDTLRVMSTRILKGTSPFHPDKTHLHHMFIELGASHMATTLAILSLNVSVVLCWWLLAVSGAPIDVQLYAVAGMSLLATFGLYHFMQWHLDRNTELLRKIRRIGYGIHISRTRGFIWLQKTIDRI